MAPSVSRRPKLLLLDCYSLAFRAFYALPEDLQTSDGTHTNAVYGFTAMLIKLLQEQRPDFIACCIDMAAPLERSTEYEHYKTNRTKAPDTFSSQIPLIREVLETMRIPIFGLEGHEADDLISYLAKSASGEDVDVRIVTGDRDFFQLVNRKIHVLYNRRGITDIVEMDAQAVEARYGVPPSKYVDLKALEGDTSDNLPGVPGVGTKTAARLVQKYGSAEAAVDHAAEQTPKLAANLAAHAEQVAINKKLSRLAEVPLEDVAIEHLRMAAWDLEEIRKLFISLEFRTLLERLLADLPEAAEGEGTPFELDVRVFADPQAVEVLGKELQMCDRCAVDVVATAPRGRPLSIAFAWTDPAGEEEAEAKVAFVPAGAGGVGPEDLKRSLGAVFADERIGKVVHDGRALVLAMSALGVEVGGLHLDTHIGAYLLDPGAPGYSLEDIARKYTGRELKAVDGVVEEQGGQTSLDISMEDESLPAEEASLRALAVGEAADAIEKELERLSMLELYRTVEHPLIAVLAEMERTGVEIDLPYLEAMGADLGARIAALAAECYEIAGEKINLGSPVQLRVLLYDKLGLKTTRRTKSGLSTDARALQQLVDQHPFVGKLLEYRELAKLKNTYVDALPPLVDPNDGRLHTTYDQTVATTGRLSSTNPNLMNIPIRTEIGRKIRRAFVAGEGRLLLSTDYSQIELRVMAHLSSDPVLIEVFDRGEDIHTATAARVYGLDPSELTTKHRSVAKMVNYGLAYGMGASGLAERLNVPVEEARTVMDAYFDQFAGVKRWLDEVVHRAHADGFTTTMFGRRRYLPELGSGNPRIRAIGERQALNAPIQGSAADIMKLAMIEVDRALRSGSLEAKMILTVHDELVLEVPESELDDARRLIEAAMTGVCEMRVPLEVDTSSGPSWAESKS